MKRVVAFLTAAVTAAASCISAMAEETAGVYEVEDTVRVGEYDCRVEDGEYYTEIDGETYLVIDLDDCEWTADEEFSRSAGSSEWRNGPEVDISDGSKYKGTADISEGDDSTPIFIGYDPKTASPGKLDYAMYAGFIFGNLYKVQIHVYDYINDNWTYTYKALNFSFAGQTKILFSGSSNYTPSKICVTFLQDGSTGEKTIGYQVYIVTP